MNVGELFEHLNLIEVNGIGRVLKNMTCEYRDYDRDPENPAWERLVCHLALKK